MEDLKDKDPAAYAELVKDLDIDTPAIKIRLEQHNGMIYAYREEDNGFIGQGTDYDTVVASIAQRLKNATVEIVNGDMLQKNNA